LPALGVVAGVVTGELRILPLLLGGTPSSLFILT
jgi:hypothetical protein